MAAPGRNIGLLGGSFNPAHEGHLYISEQAKQKLALDEIWWLLSPQNPLKPKDITADYAQRKNGIETLLKNHPFIFLNEIEKEQQLSYTIDTLTTLKQTHPCDHFIWLMGADNLLQFHRWRDYQTIANTCRIAVLHREQDKCNKEIALTSPTAQMLEPNQVLPKNLISTPPPAWCYIDIPPHSASSTMLRKKK